MSTKTQTPQTALAEAEEHLQTVWDRIMASDPKVTHEDFERAQSRVRFEQTRVEVARKAEAQREEEERKQRIAEMAEEIAALAADPALAEAREHLAAALDTYAAAAIRVANRHADLYMDGVRMGAGWQFSPSTAGVSTSKGTFHKPNPELEIVRLATDALKKHGYRDHFTMKA
jgi:hypothetical protein